MSHACRHDHAVATVSMHGHAWDLCEAALCAPASARWHASSVSEHDSIKSIGMQLMVGVAGIEWDSLLLTDEGAELVFINNEVVEMLSRRYIEDHVNVNVNN